jgi:hypothetical protein
LSSFTRPARKAETLRVTKVSPCSSAVAASRPSRVSHRQLGAAPDDGSVDRQHASVECGHHVVVDPWTHHQAGGAILAAQARGGILDLQQVQRRDERLPARDGGRPGYQSGIGVAGPGLAQLQHDAGVEQEHHSILSR